MMDCETVAMAKILLHQPECMQYNDDGMIYRGFSHVCSIHAVLCRRLEMYCSRMHFSGAIEIIENWGCEATQRQKSTIIVS